MRGTLAVCLLTIACGQAATPPTTTTAPPPTTTTTIPATTTTGAELLEVCPAAPYELESLPARVGSTLLDPDTIEPDVWTSVGGTRSTFWGRSDGTVAIALIRGTLPAVDWPAEKGEVFIDGTRGVAGPHPDGTWVVGWFEQPAARCDLYTMVFYPPVAPQEVEATILGMNRVGG